MTLSEPAEGRPPGTEGPPPAGGPTPAAADGRGSAGGGGTAQATSQYLGVLAVLGLLVVLLAVTQPEFLTIDNFLNVAESSVVLLLLATGLTFVLLTGGIDLSVGSMAGFSAIVCWTLLGTLPDGLAMAAAVAVAGVVALVTNGLLIGRAGLSFLVVTIGTGSLLHGLAQIRSGGQSQTVYQHSFLVSAGSGRVAGVPVTVLLAAGVFVAALLVLRYTGFGRMVYAVGGNPEAARLAGINVTGVRVAVYTLCGTLAGLAGVVGAARLTSASPDAGLGLELTAGAAVLLGGTSFTGGRGSLLGTLLGVLFLGILQNGVTLAGVSPFWSNVVSGVVLIVAIGIDRLRTGRAMP